KTEGKTTEQFASGEVAYLLNSGVSDGTQKWYQTLGEDGAPTLDNTCGTVYGGYAYCGSSERLYANAPLLFETRPGHSYTDGVCDICGAEKSIVIIEDDMHAEGFVLGANTVSDCKAELNTAEMYVEIKNVSGDALTDTDLVGTGATITYYDSTTNAAVKTVTVVLYGDVDGDGRINAADKDTVMLKAVGAAEIENAWFLEAADANRDGVVDAFDAALINLQAANSYPISQKIG
ncbi:MAG: dockerin type I repeat-containing protein, partial [Candidatus Fimenecus sp.]